MFNWLKQKSGRALVRFLEKPLSDYETFSTNDAETLRAIMQPGDILLVEGHSRFSLAIKYLTQSTWSHSALYVGEALAEGVADREPRRLIEADIGQGVIAVPLSKYSSFNTRICRPVGLSNADCDTLLQFVLARVGDQYDLKNVLDLVRYLLPTPPVPLRWRRRMLALGSGDPTRAICSTLIAQAFQAIRYPILPLSDDSEEGLHIRHYSLYTPRDFDVSPYFKVIKPTIEKGFSYKDVAWSRDALQEFSKIEG